MVLLKFLTWLIDRDATLSQSEIARRAGLSQSAVNKIFKQRGVAQSAETYEALATAFPTQWADFLAEHTRLAEELREQYSFTKPLFVEPARRRVRSA
jgi:transcriptional regulator with XRE-family HTH domain